MKRNIKCITDASYHFQSMQINSVKRFSLWFTNFSNQMQSSYDSSIFPFYSNCYLIPQLDGYTDHTLIYHSIEQHRWLTFTHVDCFGSVTTPFLPVRKVCQGLVGFDPSATSYRNHTEA